MACVWVGRMDVVMRVSVVVCMVMIVTVVMPVLVGLCIQAA
jgi:hypothetical protein